MFLGLALGVVLIISGCGGNEPAPPNPSKEKSPNAGTGGKFLLASEPTGARGILDIKKDAKDGDEVVLLGRIGGSKTPFTGRAAFTVVDASFTACSEIEGDTCPTPWDFCCAAPPDELAKGTLLVKFVDENGKTLAQDAKALLGISELQTIVVRGHVRQGADNSLSLVASGIFIKK